MLNRPTLKTIAKQAGLSHVAVSKALRDAPDISKATKERVKKIAEEVGYTPNLAALRAAGLSIAMGNAPKNVKDAAARIAPSNAEDGAAWAVLSCLE